MAVATIFAGTSDGYLQSISTDYATARTGGTLSVGATSGSLLVGQRKVSADYYVLEAFVQFVTSGIPGTPTAVSLMLGEQSVFGAVTVEARLYDWSTSLTTADFQSGAVLDSLPLLATASGASGGWWTFTENGSAFVDNLNLSGSTQLILTAARTRTGNAPTGNEYVTFASANQSGTNIDPKIEVTYTAAGGQVKIVGGATKPTKIFPGGVEKPVKLYNGATWELV